MKSISRVVVGVVIVSSLLFACELNVDNNKPNKSYIEISIVDSPSEYDAVLLDIVGVKYNRSSSENDNWVELSKVHTGIFEFKSGIVQPLATSFVDTGAMKQIQLLLGDNNAVVILSDTMPLSTPSAQQTGLKIKFDEAIGGGSVCKVLLEIDMSSSIIKAGNSGKYQLKPVIRAIAEKKTGAISGAIADSIKAKVYAIAGSDSISAKPDKQGAFVLRGLPVGAYDVLVQPEKNFTDTLLRGIQVSQDETTKLGKIELDKK